MPKLIKPFNGERAIDVITGFYGFEGKPQVMEPLFLKGSVGHDVCCNQYQAGQIQVGIDRLRMIKQRDEKNEITTECQRAEESLAALINTFRLDCGDCLNAKCPHRDPGSPVEEVQKRAKFFDIMGLPIQLVEEA